MDTRIVILDFSDGKVYIRTVPMDKRHDEGEDVLEYFCVELDISSSDCQYMIGKFEVDDGTRHEVAD